jgi:hypothetical protein
VKLSPPSDDADALKPAKVGVVEGDKSQFMDMRYGRNLAIGEWRGLTPTDQTRSLERVPFRRGTVVFKDRHRREHDL